MEWLENLLSRRRVKIHLYHCSSMAARVADASDVQQLQAVGTALQALRADGPSSGLGTAVRQVLNDFRGSSLSSVIMVTDGVTTEGEDLVRVSRYAAQMGVPLFFIGMGDAHDVRDLKLHDLQVEDAIYVDDYLIFEARLTAQGYPDGRTVTVRLWEKNRDGTLRRLDAEERITTIPKVSRSSFV